MDNGKDPNITSQVMVSPEVADKLRKVHDKKEEKTSERNFKVILDVDRIYDMVTVDEFIEVESGEIQAVVALVSKCLWDEDKNEYLDYEEARPVIGKMKLATLRDLASTIMDAMDEKAVPKDSEEEYG